MKPLNNALDRLVAALQFLTTLPLGASARFDPMGMVAWFPVVGLILGTLVSAFDLIAVQIWPAPVAGLLDLVLLTILTGALHLDGLADTADGLFSHRSRERALAIMKDSRIGAMGMVGVVFVLAVKWACLAELESHRQLVLVLVPAYARASMIFAIGSLPYGRPEGGTGHGLFARPLNRSDYAAVALPVALSAFLGWQGLALVLAFAAGTAVLTSFYRRALGCVTGDMLGAMTEVLEAVLLLAAAAGFHAL